MRLAGISRLVMALRLWQKVALPDRLPARLAAYTFWSLLLLLLMLLLGAVALAVAVAFAFAVAV